jgi:hypothetical protein
MWTVGDILKTIADFVDGSGVCLSDPAGHARALELYNAINEELLADDSWDGAWHTVEFEVCDGCFSLPSQFETIRALTLNHAPTQIRPGGWRFLEQGPTMACGCGLDGIMDMGDHFATAKDLSVPLPLAIYSDRPEDATAQAILQGLTAEGKEIWRGDFPGMVAEPGERIQIVGAAFYPTAGMPAQALITNNVFARRPTMVTKPVTRGNVYLFGFDAVLGLHEWLATYRPTETRPAFRRYRLNNAPNHAVSVIAEVDTRFTEAVNDGEMALIQFRTPYRIYAQALNARKAERFDVYQQFRNSALSKLKRVREKKIESQSHTLNISPVRTGASIRTATAWGVRGWR